jgi:FAD/FMN-containing dehydrogenase/Fe-S oxidoreductase
MKVDSPDDLQPERSGKGTPQFTVAFHPRVGDSGLASRLRRNVEGEVLFDRASRGRYATDASIYQIEPVGVVIPKTEEAARIAVQIAIEEGIPVLPRGGGTSQCGQTVGAALVIDNSKYLKNILEVDPVARIAVVQPGLVLDHLNAALKKHGLWFPVDVSTSGQATIGGMAGNNSCGSRSIRYGNMVHSVLGIDALLADGGRHFFGPSDRVGAGDPAYRSLIEKVHAIVGREAEEIAARWPKVLRHVQGYNIDMVQPAGFHNLAHLLVGSEGTLAYSERVHLKLWTIPKHKTLWVVHFASFQKAMALTQEIVKLDPEAVELVDRTMIDLSREIPAYRAVIDRYVSGAPEAILLVEFAGEDRSAQIASLRRLVELMADLGLPGSVRELTDPSEQKELWEVRKAGLNIMMSMKGDGKPVSFIEDCAVPLEHLEEYTEKLTAVFHKHGTRGTWYAHASVGTLHVRPILNMKEDGAKKMRAIAEEACALVKQFKGAYSGEHGDGLIRSQWIEPIIGARLTKTLEEIKDLFDPRGLMNPGKIVRAPRQDDRTLFRFKPGYQAQDISTALDWSEWGGFAGAIEMCNNNGHCRKFDAGTMCPSYRVTGNERDLTRGRANTLRLAISGQLGPNALTSDAMAETMDLCVGCKGCKRECPTGVDMAKMKIEFLAQYHERHGWRLRDRLISHLPRYGRWLARVPGFANLRDRLPGAAKLSESWFGLSARRTLPKWRSDTFLRTHRVSVPTGDATPLATSEKAVVLLADTFNNYFDAENLHAAARVLHAAGYRVHIAKPIQGARPLCCGRTFLAVGDVDGARAEARRTIDALLPWAEAGIAIVGLEPSCLFTLRDEFKSLGLNGADAVAERAVLFEEFIATEHAAGRFNPRLKALPEKHALLHGHCHQKAFGAMSAVQKSLALIPDLAVSTIESSCCGMAGAFGYEASHYDVSMQMAEASLLPAVRAAAADTIIVADGTSCRHQIADGAGREAIHVARLLEQALA